MRAGTYRHRLTLVSRTVTSQDSHGQDVTARTVIGTYWGEVRALQGREMQAAQQKWSDAKFRVETRYQPGVSFSTDRSIEWGSRTLDILSAEDPDGMQRRMVIYCREVT